MGIEPLRLGMFNDYPSPAVDKMIKAVFFDLDGTLLNTSKDLGAALNAVRQTYGLSPLPDNLIRKEVSNGASALVKLGFGETTDDELRRYRHELLAYYKENIALYSCVFDGIYELVESLTQAELQWGIVTNKPEAYTAPLMQHFAFASPPCVVVCPEHVESAKPNPQGLLLACNKARCLPHEAIYVGDHLRDIEAGKNANMTTIAAGYGFTETPSCHLTWGANYAVSTAHEIWPIIQTLHHT
jgi:phosphoglycolate phosphatase